MRRLFKFGMALFVIACEEVIPEGAPNHEIHLSCCYRLKLADNLTDEQILAIGRKKKRAKIKNNTTV